MLKKEKKLGRPVQRGERSQRKEANQIPGRRRSQRRGANQRPGRRRSQRGSQSGEADASGLGSDGEGRFSLDRETAGLGAQEEKFLRREAKVVWLLTVWVWLLASRDSKKGTTFGFQEEKDREGRARGHLPCLLGDSEQV